jgi:hypothetical protein
VRAYACSKAGSSIGNIHPLNARHPEKETKFFNPNLFGKVRETG